MIRQKLHDELLKRLSEKRRFIQVLAGPRQVGKTTLIRQVMASARVPAHYASADEPSGPGDRVWLQQQWERARIQAQESPAGSLLILDEIQKITDWSNLVKFLWDADTHAGLPLKVVLLGSAPLLLQRGLTESLAGRFEVIAAAHWSFPEMQAAFGWSLETFIFHGAYPGAAELVTEPERWRRYLQDALIETTLSRDILTLNRVDKPALLRRLFTLGCAYSGQILAYTKMLGQLTDAGNTTTLAHYLELLEGAGMLAGLGKFSPQAIRRRASSPKLQVLNTGLMTALDQHSLPAARADGDYWGRLVESAVGAHLLNSTLGTNLAVHYWREGNLEVDFVLSHGTQVAAIEVKSGARRATLSGMAAFATRFRPQRQLLVGGAGGIPLEEFLSHPAAHWLG